jgi:hypothetical protein
MSWDFAMQLAVLATEAPPAGEQPPPGESDATRFLAIWGAVTGTAGLVISWLGRRDVKWRKAAKQIPLVRPALIALQIALAEAEQRSRLITSLKALDLRAHLETIEDHTPRISDKQLASHLNEVVSTYTAVRALDDNATDLKKNTTLKKAVRAVKTSLDRVTEIERKAPA